MSDANEFTDLMRRVRLCDQDAAATLVRRYETELRRYVRQKMRSRLRSLVDSLDVCQSVLANFLRCAREGRYELNTPDQLLALLRRMSYNKVLDQFDRYCAEKRQENRRVADGSGVLAAATGDGETPSELVGRREVETLLTQMMSADDRQLFDLRNDQELSWEDIGRSLGCSGEAARKRFDRARTYLEGEHARLCK